MASAQNPIKPVSSFLASPRFFNGFFMAKSLSDEESSSPTSVLDTKQLFSSFGSNPFRFNKNPFKPRKIFEEIKNPSEKFESENGIALALIQENPNDSLSKPNSVISRRVLFGSNLKIQIPSYPQSDPFPNGSDCSDYGIKTRNLQFSVSPTATGSGSPGASMAPLSLREMEVLEEYTRVICHGSNPKTTHIYDNCVVECCCGVLESGPDPKSPWESFLSFCHTCKKSLGEDSDIFMYRGEKGFCSEECRRQEMVLDEVVNQEQLCQ